MQDLRVLADSASGFDMGKVDLSKSVIVGDPDDMRDVRYSFPRYPAREKRRRRSPGSWASPSRMS